MHPPYLLLPATARQMGYQGHPNGLLDAEGNFQLTTVRSTDSKGERKNGAPAGEYKVVFIPKNEDQTVAYVPPVTLPNPVKIEAKENVLTLDAPK